MALAVYAYVFAVGQVSNNAKQKRAYEKALKNGRSTRSYALHIGVVILTAKNTSN